MTRSGWIRNLTRVGLSASHRDGPGSWIHHLALVLAGVATLLTVSAFLAVQVSTEQRTDRAQARSPVLALERPGAEVVGYWLAIGDSVGTRQISVVALAPTGPDSPLPPGLPRWPGPGEAFLSPALAEQGPAVSARYGDVAGVIGRAGLVQPREEVVYLRPLNDQVLKSRPDVRIVGFGSQRPGGFFVADRSRPASALYWLLAGFVAAPALLLLVVCARTGSETRDARLRMLEALGATRRQRSVTVIGESALPVLFGVGTTGLVVAAMTFQDLPIPGTGYVVPAGDLSALRPMLIAAAVASWIIVMLAATALHFSNARVVGNRPRPLGAPLSRWRALLLGASLVMTGVGAALRGNLGSQLFFVGMIATLLTVPIVVGHFGAALGGAVARLRSPAAVVGGRWLQARPAVAARLSTALVVGLVVITQVQVWQSRLDEGESAAFDQLQRAGSNVVEVRGANIRPETIQAFDSSLSPTMGLVVATIDRRTGPQIQGDCASLRKLGTSVGCPRESTAIRIGFEGTGARLDTLREWFLGRSARIHVQAIDPVLAHSDKGRLFVLSRGSERTLAHIKQAAIASFGTPIIDRPGESWLTGVAARAALTGWVILAGVIGLLLLGLAGAVGAAGTFVEQARNLGPLATFAGTRTFYRRIAAFSVTLPLLAAVLVGGLVATWLGVLHISAADEGKFSGVVLGTSALVGATLAAVTGVLSGEVSIRALGRWRPSGD